jgi:hypothetical protein
MLTAFGTGIILIKNTKLKYTSQDHTGVGGLANELYTWVNISNTCLFFFLMIADFSL